jgi:hypothetical protein
MFTKIIGGVNTSATHYCASNCARNNSGKDYKIPLILFITLVILFLNKNWVLEFFRRSTSFDYGRTYAFHNEKSRLKNCYYTTNFWNYDELRPPFTGLPSDFYRIYMTDQNDSRASRRLLDLGWNKVLVVNLSDRNNFDRRMFVSRARLFPELFAPLGACERVFFTDANIIAAESSRYETWARSMKNSSALLIMLGYYSGKRDDIDVELQESICQERWRYSWTAMTERTRYYQRVILNRTNSTKARVASAKYLGWNMAHPHRHLVAEWLLHEASIHVQGNIAISVAVVLFPHLVQAENCSLWAHLASHRQSY